MNKSGRSKYSLMKQLNSDDAALKICIIAQYSASFLFLKLLNNLRNVLLSSSYAQPDYSPVLFPIFKMVALTRLLSAAFFFVAALAVTDTPGFEAVQKAAGKTRLQVGNTYAFRSGPKIGHTRLIVGTVVINDHHQRDFDANMFELLKDAKTRVEIVRGGTFPLYVSVVTALTDDYSSVSPKVRWLTA